MADKTASSRVKRQREARIRQGWHEVRVWVPNDADAKALRIEAKKMRIEAINKQHRREENSIRFSRSIIDENYTNIQFNYYNNVSGYIKYIVLDLARSGDLIGISREYSTFLLKNPSPSEDIKSFISGIIRDIFWLERNDVITLSKFFIWEKQNSGWRKTIEENLRFPGNFSMVVSAMTEELLA